MNNTQLFHLHSTMFIFIYNEVYLYSYILSHLHSTMFIFIFNASFGIPLEKCPFTFHYVYIYIVFGIV